MSVDLDRLNRDQRQLESLSDSSTQSAGFLSDQMLCLVLAVGTVLKVPDSSQGSGSMV